MANTTLATPPLSTLANNVYRLQSQRSIRPQALRRGHLGSLRRRKKKKKKGTRFSTSFISTETAVGAATVLKWTQSAVLCLLGSARGIQTLFPLVKKISYAIREIPFGCLYWSGVEWGGVGYIHKKNNKPVTRSRVPQATTRHETHDLFTLDDPLHCRYLSPRFQQFSHVKTNEVWSL